MKEELPTRPGFLRLRVGLLGWVQAAGAVAGGATVAGFLGRFWWGLDLFSHFRVQYCFGLGAVALILLIVRRFRMALMMAAFSVLNLGLVVPLYVGASLPGYAPGPVLRAMLINVNTRSGDPARVARAIHEANPDIVVLEEISSGWIDRLEPELLEWPHVCREPREDNFGIGLFSKFPLDNPRLLNVGEAGVPTIVAEVKLESGWLTVVATHPLPPVGRTYFRWRNDQLEKLPSVVKSTVFPVLLLGDLNVSPWSFYFVRLLKDSGLKDSARGFGVQPSWPTWCPPLRIPIDHVLCSPVIRVVGRRVGPAVGSDHFPVIVDLALLGERTGGPDVGN